MRGLSNLRVMGQCALYLMACLLIWPLTACNKQGPKPSGTVLVAMADNSFSPAIVRVPVGGSILFHNAGRNPHNAVAVDKSWSTEATFGNIEMKPDTMTEVVFAKQGVYPYFCTYHGTPDGKSGMVGVVIVGNVEYKPESSGRAGLKPVEKPTGVVRHVPQEYPNIQAAVDGANPGDLILVDKGVYNEQVFVTTPGITIRGVDRNAVILDGGFEYGNGIMVGADGVAIENMTARNYTLNGFYWTGVKGFRGSYLTSYRTGDYGIYAFGSSDGVLNHDYASGSPDSAYYVGQCNPCKVVVDHVVGEYSGLGYSGTNSSGDMYVINSIFRYNKSGIGTSTFDIELNPPGHATTIIGNIVADNGFDDAAAFYATASLGGIGIVNAGTNANLVERNYVVNNSQYGIMNLPINDRHYWPATKNIVRGNVVRSSGKADLATSGFGSIGNCFAGNSFRTSMPWGLQLLNNCDGPRVLPLGSELSGLMHFYAGIAKVREGKFKTKSYQLQPIPGPQQTMPGGASAAVIPALHPFEDYPLDLKSIKVPVSGDVQQTSLERRP
jgi:plastocyanin